ncbi:MAG: VCBS repeat-containing protein [Minicystis sp.]
MQTPPAPRSIAPAKRASRSALSSLIGARSLAPFLAPFLALPLGCAPPSPAPPPPEDLGSAAEALTLGDWSQFPDGHQCVVGVQIFYQAKFGVTVPPTGGPGWNGNCAPLGACHLWLDVIPSDNDWYRIPNDGAELPTTYDMIVYPPTATNEYGHIASVDHVTDGVIYVMDDNYCANNCEKKAVEPHTVSSKAYGWYHLKQLGPPFQACVPSAEVCDGQDNDCDGQVDEDLVQPCGSDVGECSAGTQKCEGGAWGACIGAVGPGVEVCDGKDNDCSGVADDHQVCELDEADEAALFDLGPSSDVDGDGRADACTLSDTGIRCAPSGDHGFGAEQPALAALDVLDVNARSVFTTLRLGDIDGDGLADVCLRQPEGMTCWLSTGHGFGSRVKGPSWSDEKGYNEADFSTIRLADIDGDGRADLCARGPAGFTCHRSTGKDFTPWPTLEALSDAAGFADPSRYATLRMGDIDGDGSADVCARFPEGMACFRASDHGFTERVLGPAWSDAGGFSAWQRWSTIRLADVNGDGRADLCAHEPEGFRCYLSDGRGFSAKVLGPALASAGMDGSHRERPGSLRLADLDGDGRVDLCARGPLSPKGTDADPQGLTCFLWSGHGFDRPVAPLPLGDEDGWTRPDHYRTLRLADVDGDGQSDLCARSAQGLSCWLYHEGRFDRAFPGPAWSDDAGFTAAARYGSLRLAGSPPHPTSGIGAKAPSEGGSDLAKPGCSAAVPASTPGALLPFGLLLLPLLLRRRRGPAPSKD